jgi:hypothetical protein
MVVPVATLSMTSGGPLVSAGVARAAMTDAWSVDRSVWVPG